MYGGGWEGIFVLISAHVLFCLAAATSPITVNPYLVNPIPIAYNNSPTTDTGCLTGGDTLICGGSTLLVDSDTGSAELDTSKVFAWDREVNIVFTIPSTKVRQVNLFFYNIPSSGIGLPPAELFWSNNHPTNPDITLSHVIVGNQDLSQDDRTLRNVSLVVTTDQDNDPSISDYRYFRLHFTLPAETSLIDWILLSEVQLCEEPEPDEVPSSTPSTTPPPSVSSITSITPLPSITFPPSITSPPPSITTPSSSGIGGIIGGVVGALIVAIIIVTVLIAIIMLVRWKQCTGKLQMAFTNVDCENYTPESTTADPLYSEVKRSSPPPLPKCLYFTDTHATVDNMGNNGHTELVDTNNHCNSISSAPSVPDPMPSKLRHQPSFHINPSYIPVDQPDRPAGGVRRGSAPSVGMADSPGQSTLNIYAKPSRIQLPSSHTPSSPPSHPAPIYSESITPSHFREARSLSPPETELHPYGSIYNDPQPLKRSEGPLEVTAQQIHEKQNLGVGQFGQVVLAETIGLSLNDLKLSTSNDDKSISILVALKKLKPNAERPVKEAFEKEIKFMSRLNNDSIVRLLGICLSDNPFILMEYMENGDLNQYLRKFETAPLEAPPGENQLPPSTLLYMAMQIAMGMQYLASLRFVHRDLATRNCLVGANYLVKIADFGMSGSLYSSDYYRITGRALLPIRWMANECFYGRFTEKTDVWAFGVTMWEIFTFAKKQPYEGMLDHEVIDDSMKGPDRQSLPKPEACPFEVYEIILRCWEHEPSERADFEEIQSSLAALHAYSDIP